MLNPNFGQRTFSRDFHEKTPELKLKEIADLFGHGHANYDEKKLLVIAQVAQEVLDKAVKEPYWFNSSMMGNYILPQHLVRAFSIMEESKNESVQSIAKQCLSVAKKILTIAKERNERKTKEWFLDFAMFRFKQDHILDYIPSKDDFKGKEDAIFLTKKSEDQYVYTFLDENGDPKSIEKHMSFLYTRADAIDNTIAYVEKYRDMSQFCREQAPKSLLTVTLAPHIFEDRIVASFTSKVPGSATLTVDVNDFRTFKNKSIRLINQFAGEHYTQQIGKIYGSGFMQSETLLEYNYEPNSDHIACSFNNMDSGVKTLMLSTDPAKFEEETKKLIEAPHKAFIDHYLNQRIPEFKNTQTVTLEELQSSFVLTPSPPGIYPFNITLHYLDLNNVVQKREIKVPFGTTEYDKFVEGAKLANIIRKAREIYPALEIRFGTEQDVKLGRIIIDTSGFTSRILCLDLYGKEAVAARPITTEIMQNLCNRAQIHLVFMPINEQMKSWWLNPRAGFNEWSVSYTPENGYKIGEIKLNGENLEAIKADALRVVIEKRQLIFDKLVSTYGKDRVFLEETELEPDQYAIVASPTVAQIYFLDYLGKSRNYSILANDPMNQSDIDRIITTQAFLRSYMNQPDALPFKFCEWFLASDDKSGLIVRAGKKYSTLLVEYTHPISQQVISRPVTFETFAATMKACDEEYRVLAQLPNLEATSEIRIKTSAQSGVPPYLEEGRPDLLLDMFKQIEFANKEHPYFMNPEGIKENRKILTLQELEEKLVKLIRIVNAGGDVNGENGHYWGIPDEPADREKYYSNLRAYLSQIVVKLKNDESVPVDLKNEILVAFAIGGGHCGGRWIGEAIQHYNELSGKMSDTLEESFLSMVDRFKLNIIEEMDHVDGDSNVHKYIAICKALGEGSGIGIPASAGADYNDPYAADALVASSYPDTDAVREGFMKKFEAPAIMEWIFDQANDSIRNKNEKFLGMLQVKLHDMVYDRLHSTEKRRLDPIDKAFAARNHAINVAPELSEDVVNQKIQTGEALIRGLKPLPEEGSPFEIGQIKLLNRAIRQWSNVSRSDQSPEAKETDLKDIIKEYGEKLSQYKTDLLEQAKAEHRFAIKQLIDTDITIKYLQFNDDGELTKVTPLAIVDLLRHMNMLQPKI